MPNTLPDGFAQRLGPVDHEQQPLLDVQAAVDEVGQQCASDGRVLGGAVPQAERELVALGRDPQRDDVGAAVQLDPVEHDHRQPQVGQRPVHQLPQQVAGSLHERPGHRRLRRRPGIGLDLDTDRLLRAAVLAGRDAGEHPLQYDLAELVAVGEVLVGR